MEAQGILANTHDEVLRALQANSSFQFGPQLHSFHLHWHPLKPPAIKYFSEALKRNSTITSLELRWNELGDEGMKYLSEALQHNSTLTKLDITSNEVGDEGAKYLSDALKHNSSISKLILTHNRLNEKAAEYLCEMLKCNSTLTHLTASRNDFGDEGMKYLSDALTQNSTLTYLDIGSNELHPRGVSYISEALIYNTTLTHLFLDCACYKINLTREAEIKYHDDKLPPPPTGNEIADGGVMLLSDALKYNSTLTLLNLCHTRYENEGLKHLSEALKFNSTLVHLCLGATGDYPFMGINLGEGAKHLSEALQHNSSLTHLDASESNLGDEGVKYLSEALKNNCVLTKLSLARTNLKDEGVKYLSEAMRHNSTLTHLNLAGNEFEGCGAKYLSEALQHNSTLIQLYVCDNQLRAEGVKYLSEALKFNTTLLHLNLQCCQMRDEGAKYVSESLRHNSTLTHLDMDGNDIGEEGARHLFEAVQYNNSLTKLDIGSNNWSCKIVEYVSEVIKHNSSITYLDIRSTKTQTDAKDRETSLWENLLETLKQNFSLTKLLLPPYDNGVGNEIMLPTTRFLLRNKLLTNMKQTDELVVFLQEGMLTDITIRTRDCENIRAHKIILAARSSFFRTLLVERGEGRGDEIDLIELENVSSRYLRILLRYLYTDTLDIGCFKNRDDMQDFAKCVSMLAPEQLNRVRNLMATQLIPTDDFVEYSVPVWAKPTIRDIPANMSKQMSWAVNNALFHDVVFVVGESEKKRFLAHKIILCARSSYFKALLTGGLKESQEEEIHIQTVNPDAFSIVLEYLYTKDLNVVTPTSISGELMIDAFALSNHYSVEPLKCKLEAILALHITEENVCSLLLLADAYQANRLKHECCKYFVAHRDQVVNSSQREYFLRHSTQIDEIIKNFAVK